jgi:hypothetical protein
MALPSRIALSEGRFRLFNLETKLHNIEYFSRLTALNTESERRLSPHSAGQANL